MRTDVKLGIVSSMVVVLVAGGYFLFRSDSQTPISIADKAKPAAPKSAAKPGAGKLPVTNPARQVTSSKDAPKLTNLPVNRDAKVAAKPAERPPVTPLKERGPVAQPLAEPVASAPVVETKTDGQANLPATQPLVMERSSDLTPSAPVSSPVGAVASREADAGFTSRTLMAGEGAKTTPTTPAESAGPTSAVKPLPSGVLAQNSSYLAKAAVETHRVQPGDSLASLAQTYYGNAKYANFLAESNPGISDPARLALGASVKIPPLPQDIDTRMSNATATKATAAPTVNAAGKRTYKVKSGDSFYKIAKDQLGNAERWKELLALNKALVHGDPSSLQPGQTLVLPD